MKVTSFWIIYFINNPSNLALPFQDRFILPIFSTYYSPIHDIYQFICHYQAREMILESVERRWITILGVQLVL